ncbi:MAG: uroporphyrinogen-III synthase [Alphaproteobacteria bacterium]
MRLLVTRPAEDAAELAERLHGLGIETILAPLFTIEPLAGAAVNLAGVQAIIFTSANGVRAFAQACRERSYPVFAVGQATAGAARKAGFARIESAGGDVGDLARLIARQLDPGAGALYQASGRDVAGDLASALELAGFTLRREILYRAEVAAELPPEATRAMSVRTLDGVLLFSPRTGAEFVRLVLAADLEESLSGMYAYCLSQSIADKVACVRWRDVRVAAEPSQQSLLDLVAGDLPR